MDDVLNYEDLVARFNESLLTNLRQHGADAEGLDTWVPDEDPVKSLLNMVEAAELAGRETLAVRLRAETMDAAQRAALLDAVADLGRAAFTPDGDGFVLTVRELGG